jgi:hypothetical protein
MYEVVEEVTREFFLIWKMKNFTSLKFPVIKAGWKQGSASESKKRS